MPIILGIKYIDYLLSLKISEYLAYYNLEATTGLITDQIPLFIKIVIYLLIFIIPFLIWKLVHPLNKHLNVIIIIFLFFIAIFAFGIFLGFLQIFYS